MKKAKSVLLSLAAALMFTALMLTACGKETNENTSTSEIGTEGLEYTLLADGTYSVSIGKAIYSSEITIPAVYNDKPVAQIAAGGFANTEELYTIRIPSSIKRIGADAFKSSDSIETLIISDLAAWCSVSFETRYSNPLLYASVVYADGESAQELVIPEGVRSISEYAFAGSSVIETVILPDSLESVGKWAFSACPKLQSVTFGDGIRKVGSDAFKDSGALKYTESGSVCYLGNAENPTLVLVGAKQKIISGGSSVKNCEVNESTAVIADGAFEKCSELESITVSSSVKSMGARAFAGCEALARVDISDLSAWCGIEFDGYYANPLYYAREGLYLNKAASPVKSLDTQKHGVTLISAYAFHNYAALSELKLHDGVEKIGSYAFSYCTGLKSVTLGGAVSEIPERAFDHCGGIESIDFKNVKSIAPYAFYYCTGLSELDLSSAQSIGESAFYASSAVRTVILGEGIKSIGDNAFNRCTGISRLVLPDSLERIGYRAFYNCQGLMSVRLPANVSAIGDEAFFGCYKLLEVINESPLPVSVQSREHGSVALYAKDVHRGQSDIENINGFYFYSFGGVSCLLGAENTGAELRLPSDGYKGEPYIVWDYAFANSSSLEEVYIPDCVLALGNSVFARCSALVSADIGNGVTLIGDNAFADCVSLEEFVAGESVKDIGRAAFARCTGLLNAVLGDSVENVGKEAFYKCFNLASISVGADIKSFGFAAFDDCTSLAAVEIKSIAAWCGARFDSKHANPLYYSESFTQNGERITLLAVPEGVSRISEYAFFGVKSIVSISLPRTLESIGDDAFKGCSKLVEIINLSSNLKNEQGVLQALEMGEASYGCIAENAIVIHGNGSVTENVGGYIFVSTESGVYLVDYIGNERELALPSDHNGEAYSIHGYAFAKSDITGVVIPEGVLGIGDYAFFECDGITAVTIPGSVLRIGAYAFAMCDNLRTVTYDPKDPENSGEQIIGESAFRGDKNLTEFNMGEGVSYIGSAAFYGCFASDSDLGGCSITIPASVERIGNYAFAYCENLKSVTFLRKDGWHRLINEWQQEYAEKTPGAYDMSEAGFNSASAVADWLVRQYSEYFIVRIEHKADQDG